MVAVRPEAGLPALYGMVAAPDDRVRTAAVDVLVEMPRHQWDDLERLLADERSAAAGAELVRRLGAPAADLLIDMLIDQEPRRSWQAGTILVSIGRPAVPALRRRREKAGSPQQRVRINAVLGDIATTRAARPELRLPHDR